MYYIYQNTLFIISALTPLLFILDGYSSRKLRRGIFKTIGCYGFLVVGKLIVVYGTFFIITGLVSLVVFLIPLLSPNRAK
jgi:uncharacterized membrane protein YccC